MECPNTKQPTRKDNVVVWKNLDESCVTKNTKMTLADADAQASLSHL